MINVLIVDDSKFVASAIHEIVEGMGFHVVGIAHDGIQGIDRFNETAPDVTLLDITMPNMDGIDCLTRLREINPDSRVLMLSAVKDEQIVQKCLSLGASGFLHKPIRKTSPSDLEKLCTSIEEAAGKTG